MTHRSVPTRRWSGYDTGRFLPGGGLGMTHQSVPTRRWSGYDTPVGSYQEVVWV